MLSAEERKDLEDTLDFYKEQKEKNEKILKKSEQELKEKSISFAEKRQLKKTIDSHGKKIYDIDHMLYLVNNYKASYIKYNTLLEDSKKSIESCLQELDVKDKDTIEKIINESIKNSNKKVVKEDDENYKKLEEFISKAFPNENGKSIISHMQTLYNLKREKAGSIFSFEKFNSEKPKTTPIKSSEEKTLDLLQEMNNKGMLKGNKRVLYALKNSEDIIKASGEKERLKKLNSSIETLKSELSDESKLSDVNNIDFSNVVKELDKIEKENKKKIEKYEKTLKNIDFNYLRGLTKEYEEEKERNKEKENKKATFRSLVKSRIYKIEYGEDTSEINMQIERFSLDPDIKKDIIREAEMEHHKKLQEEKAAIDGRREKEEHEQELWREVKNNIRRQAIENIKKRNPFGGPFEVRNGDVYSHQSFESMVDEEMERMFEESSLSAEERGLRDMKRRGTMPSSATVGDLSYQQKMDFKNFYGDNSFGYIKEVKKVKRTVYEDYLRYRAGKPKEEVMRFFEFSQKYYDGLFTEKEAEEIESGARKL